MISHQHTSPKRKTLNPSLTILAEFVEVSDSLLCTKLWFVKGVLLCEHERRFGQGWSMNLNLVGTHCCHGVTSPESTMKVDSSAWDGGCCQFLVFTTKCGGFRWLWRFSVTVEVFGDKVFSVGVRVREWAEVTEGLRVRWGFASEVRFRGFFLT